jgi:hypothetical protein
MQWALEHDEFCMHSMFGHVNQPHFLRNAVAEMLINAPISMHSLFI